ncbi:MAG TPA: exopolyphosphatase [Ruminococcaceae bacterium]|nr:exopolyphosphatase [Oscillospiraceae bacterium]
MIIGIEKACDILKQANKILIISHKKPDGDTIGSAFSLYYSLLQLGKKARIECSDPFAPKYSYFTGGYVEYDFTPDLIVAVDLADVALFGGKTEKYADKIDLCIDHHPSNSMYAKNTLLKADAASTTELMWELIKAMGVAPDKNIANAVFTGLTTDTGCFRYSNATAQSHICAAEAIVCGAESALINRLMFETKSYERINAERRIMDTLEYFFDNHCAVITISCETVEQTGVAEDELDGISALPRQIEGVWAGVTLREKKDGSYKISLRTTDELDASAICAVFGGGGHKRAAGCVINGDGSEVKKKITDAVKQAIDKII